jgi:hypothetical protein
MLMTDRVVQLTQSALDELDSPSPQLSSVIQKAIRIARLRNDFSNSLWLEFEMVHFEDKQAVSRLKASISPHFSTAEMLAMDRSMIESYISERQFGTLNAKGEVSTASQICVLGVSMIEDHILE